MKTQQEYQDFSEQHWRNYTPSDSLPANMPGYGAILLKAWDEHQATQATQPEKEELIPFNLEEALQEPERVRFRNDETPLEWHYFAPYEGKYPITAVTINQKVSLTKEGYLFDSSAIKDYDLMLVKKKMVVWFGLYENPDGVLNTSPVMDNEEYIKNYCNTCRRKLVKLYSYEL